MRMLTPLSSMDIEPRLTASGTWFAILSPAPRPAQHPRAGGRAAAGGHRDRRGRPRDGLVRCAGGAILRARPPLRLRRRGVHTSTDQDEPSGPTFAAGLRGYTAGFRHRGFLEASVSQIFTQTHAVEPGRRLYGPGLAAGYQYAARGGFTLMTSLGLGYAPGVEGGYTKVGMLANLGLGYTWRRRAR